MSRSKHQASQSSSDFSFKALFIDFASSKIMGLWSDSSASGTTSGCARLRPPLLAGRQARGSSNGWRSRRQPGRAAYPSSSRCSKEAGQLRLRVPA